jgi:hypothetical protein
MDPYLEAPELWEDFHARLADQISAQIGPLLRPRYFAALTPRVTYEEVTVAQVRGMKPDVAVYSRRDVPFGSGGGVAVAPAPMTGTVTIDVPVKEQSIEIREAATGVLVTVIEILSPVNKRPGHDAYAAYRKKRRAIFATDVHILEIDLLRSGERPPLATPHPTTPYAVYLGRGRNRPFVGIWPIGQRDPLPVVPVPLLPPDPDVPLDLALALRSIYDRASYDLRIDYRAEPPPPALPPEDLAWLREQVSSTGARDSAT